MYDCSMSFIWILIVGFPCVLLKFLPYIIVLCLEVCLCYFVIVAAATEQCGDVDPEGSSAIVSIGAFVLHSLPSSRACV